MTSVLVRRSGFHTNRHIFNGLFYQYKNSKKTSVWLGVVDSTPTIIYSIDYCDQQSGNICFSSFLNHTDANLVLG